MDAKIDFRLLVRRDIVRNQRGSSGCYVLVGRFQSRMVSAEGDASQTPRYLEETG